jgi:hypothetical protein
MLRWLQIASLLLAALPGGCVWFSDITDLDTPDPEIVDTTPPPAPFTPATSYDFPGSRALAEQGDAALAGGDAAAAAAAYQAAIDRWPANPEAWNGLAAAYRETGGPADRDYALFFARRIAWADAAPAASVAASFRGVAAGTINRPVEDPRIQATAEQLALYYAGLDVAQRMAKVGSRAAPEDALDAVGIVPAIIGTAAMSIFVGAETIGIFLGN